MTNLVQIFEDWSDGVDYSHCWRDSINIAINISAMYQVVHKLLNCFRVDTFHFLENGRRAMHYVCRCGGSDVKRPTDIPHFVIF